MSTSIKARIDESQADIIHQLTNLVQLLTQQVTVLTAERDDLLSKLNSKPNVIHYHIEKLPPLPESPSVNTKDPMNTHPSRLQEVNPALCKARKIDEEHPLEGTRPGDEGANGMVWPELQCPKKPLQGEALCLTCKKKQEKSINMDSAVRGWYGRLDEPLCYKAGVVGCGHFHKKYPNGITKPAEKRDT